jgi:large subunit ribosomal protein L21
MGLPTLDPDGVDAEIGGLVAYFPGFRQLRRRAASQVDRILRGAKQGEIAFEQATTFQLVINLRTAKALGIAMPPSLLGRADAVIERRQPKSVLERPPATLTARPAHLYCAARRRFGMCRSGRVRCAANYTTEMMFAVIRTGGKQYKVAKDDVIAVEKLAVEPGMTVELTEVLMIGEGAEVTTGAPLLDGASVSATVVEQIRAAKIIVFKKKRRQNYRRKKGHRQQQTVLRIIDVRGANGSQPTKEVADGP